MKIKHNKKVDLKMPSFTVDDNPLGKHLDKHPCLSLLNCYANIVIIGKPGSGKTSLAVSFLQSPKVFRKTFNHIICVMPFQSRKSMKKDIFEVLPQEQLFDELNEETITTIYNLIQSYAEEGEKTLLFIDDQTASLKKSKYVEDTLKKIMFNRRHLRTTCMTTAQVYNNIPLSIRKTISHLFMFKPQKKEFESVFEELLEQPKETAQKIMNVVYDKKHNFLYLHVETQKMFKNWDEILWRDDEYLSDSSSSSSSDSDY